MPELPGEEHTLPSRRLPGSTAHDAMAKEPHANALAMEPHEEGHEGPREGAHDLLYEGPREGLDEGAHGVSLKKFHESFRSGGTLSRMLGGSTEGREPYDGQYEQYEQYEEGHETGFETWFDEEEYGGTHSGGRQLLRKTHRTKDGHYRKKVTITTTRPRV